MECLGHVNSSTGKARQSLQPATTRHVSFFLLRLCSVQVQYRAATGEWMSDRLTSWQDAAARDQKTRVSTSWQRYLSGAQPAMHLKAHGSSQSPCIWRPTEAHNLMFMLSTSMHCTSAPAVPRPGSDSPICSPNLLCKIYILRHIKMSVYTRSTKYR
jgi:hypothetical protein